MTAEERAKALLQEIEGRARVNRPFGVLRGQAVAEIASAIHSAEAEARQEAERERDEARALREQQDTDWKRAILAAQAMRDAAKAEALKAIGERDALRQAHWDGRAAAGFDNDGDPTPRAVASDFAALIRSDWRSMQESLDESRAESDAAESALASARSEALEEAARLVEARVARPGMGTMEAIAERDAVVEAIRSLKATAPTGGGK
jgi:hypothetical protein